MPRADGARLFTTEIAGHRGTILVVDDEANARNALSELLKEERYGVETAADGSTALEKLGAFTPDVVLTDLKMPGMDGLDVCKIIKENKATKHVPVVMLSGNDEVFDKVMGRLAGASDYITKPFEPETILACI